MSSPGGGRMIAAGSRIRLHFALFLEGGEEVDSNFDGEPASCTLGDGSLMPGFERYLLGLRPGDRENFTVSPEEAFGGYNSANVQLFKRSRFAGMVLEEGLVVSFSDAANSELPGVISGLDGDVVTVDFNHPLAGKTLSFQVHIIDVQ